MKRDSSYEDVLKMAVSIFFELYNPELDSLSLADSNGVTVNVSSQDTWTLGTFYQNNGLQPSRHKLYVVLQVFNGNTLRFLRIMPLIIHTEHLLIFVWSMCSSAYSCRFWNCLMLLNITFSGE